MSQFHCYAILCSAIGWPSEWAWFITSVHLCSSSSSVLKWDNVLYSLWQVARMTPLSCPQNVSITGIKRADNLAQSFKMIQLLLKCIQITDYNCILNINVSKTTEPLDIPTFLGGVITLEKLQSTLKNGSMDAIISWFMIVPLVVPQCNTQRKWRSYSQLEKGWNNCEWWRNGNNSSKHRN